jgi:succinate dehydrogenase/fumarate reductase flavoprotein subunit
MRATVTNSQTPPRQTVTFDDTFDVVVVGYGFAGAAAALSAQEAGAKVLLIEKMPDPGGISIVSGGGVRLARDPVAARQYLKAINHGRTPDALINTFADGIFHLEAYLRDLGRINNASFRMTDRPANYPYPGHDYFVFMDVDSIPGFDPTTFYPHVKGLRNGPFMFKLLDDNIRARGIEVRCETRALRLITGTDGEVRGLWIEGPDGRRAIAGRRGVILACGGFEADTSMQRQYWQFEPVFNAAFRGNTGDGIRMAADVGAELWHMWHFHGSYGFKPPGPEYPFAIRMKRLPDWTPGVREADVVMSWILLDRNGQRFTNEYEPYSQDTGHRVLDAIDPVTMTQRYIPCFAVVDDDGRKLYPLGSPVSNDRAVDPYVWSVDNEKEVANGMLKRANSIAELARILGCNEPALRGSLAQWNHACDSGHDAAFHRPGPTMHRIVKPPFLVGEIWPVVSNTQGGPVRNALQQVLTPFGEPIPRLYEAGELGSIWGYLYLSGGNLSECFVTGRIAGSEAAGLAGWCA